MIRSISWLRVQTHSGLIFRWDSVLRTTAPIHSCCNLLTARQHSVKSSGILDSSRIEKVTRQHLPDSTKTAQARLHREHSAGTSAKPLRLLKNSQGILILS